ncbi:MAG TPA: F0F1 ATP synthase subunit delta [Opitutaceae bacterium]|jgi:F-type H+-transporting ATPase subunit delta|nr:F0F1 ATP synthase subunit delta [Opitutaceae bacterium]HRE06785.1 F0F1 ATP synthase subunit delta [Opitutaceae bacterium]
MTSQQKKTQQTARQLFKLSVVDGVVSAERVAGVLAYIEKTEPARSLALLKSYQRLIATELAKSEAIVEHAGPVADAALSAIGSSMSRRYGRTVTPHARRNDALLAGVRVRVGDDIYESSVAFQLATLSASV